MRTHSALPLVQTLLVVGSLLVAVPVLYPVLRPAHRYRVSCQSNLKQILMGLNLYLNEYNAQYPLLKTGNLHPTQPPSSGWINSLQPYLKSLQIFQCPAEPNRVVGHTDYGYNSPMFGGRGQVDFALAPATLMICEIDETEGSLASASAPDVLNRHLDGSNYGFADGHVKWLQSSEAPAPSKLTFRR